MTEAKDGFQPHSYGVVQDVDHSERCCKVRAVNESLRKFSLYLLKALLYKDLYSPTKLYVPDK